MTATARPRLRRSIGLVNRNHKFFVSGIPSMITQPQIASKTPTTKNLLATIMMIAVTMNIR